MAKKKRKIQTELDAGARQEAGDHAVGRQDRGRYRQGARHLAQRRDRALARACAGIVYQSDIDSWTRANARRSAEAHKRSLIRRDLQGKIVADMLKSISSGVPREKAMEQAFKAGAYWWQIGEHFGMSQQTALRDREARQEETRARK